MLVASDSALAVRTFRELWGGRSLVITTSASEKGFGDEPQPDTGELFSDGEGPSDMDESADDDVPSD